MTDRDLVVAIDVGGTSLKGAVVDARGRALAGRRILAPTCAGPHAVIEAVLELAESLCTLHGAPVAAGLAVAGLVDERTGVVREATNLGWRDVPIGSLAQQRLGIPVTVDHDVRTASLAESLFGAARDCSDYLLMTLGTGVGAAVVIGGRPYTGAHGLGGEFGHVAVEQRGPLCGCGREGCLEALASAGRVALRYRSMCDRAPETVSAEDVARHAANGEPVAQRVWEGAVNALAVAIANYQTLLDPERVIIGGGMAKAGSSLFDPLRLRVRDLLRFGDPSPIVPAQLGEDAGRMGAAVAAWRAAGLSEAELSRWARAGESDAAA